MNNKTKLSEFEKKIERKRKLIAKHREELEALLSTCEHPEDKIIEKSHYYPGGYYDRSYVELWRECTICGKTSERVRDKSYVGSYA
mgnify:CR=1 FL=1